MNSYQNSTVRKRQESFVPKKNNSEDRPYPLVDNRPKNISAEAKSIQKNNR